MIDLLSSDNPYKVLGVERDATEAEIRHAYLALVREHPPESDPEGFKRIRIAYEKLCTGGERAEPGLFLIDEKDDFGAHAIERPTDEPPMFRPDLIRADLFALEAEFLLEELRMKSK
jgi:curved DNA-binding protein CbpA